MSTYIKNDAIDREDRQATNMRGHLSNLITTWNDRRAKRDQKVNEIQSSMDMYPERFKNAKFHVNEHGEIGVDWGGNTPKEEDLSRMGSGTNTEYKVDNTEMDKTLKVIKENEPEDRNLIKDAQNRADKVSTEIKKKEEALTPEQTYTPPPLETMSKENVNKLIGNSVYVPGIGNITIPDPVSEEEKLKAKEFAEGFDPIGIAENLNPDDLKAQQAEGQAIRNEEAKRLAEEEALKQSMYGKASPIDYQGIEGTQTAQDLQNASTYERNSSSIQAGERYRNNYGSMHIQSTPGVEHTTTKDPYIKDEIKRNAVDLTLRGTIFNNQGLKDLATQRIKDVEAYNTAMSGKGVTKEYNPGTVSIQRNYGEQDADWKRKNQESTTKDTKLPKSPGPGKLVLKGRSYTGLDNNKAEFVVDQYDNIRDVTQGAFDPYWTSSDSYREAERNGDQKAKIELTKIGIVDMATERVGGSWSVTLANENGRRVYWLHGYDQDGNKGKMRVHYANKEKKWAFTVGKGNKGNTVGLIFGNPAQSDDFNVGQGYNTNTIQNVIEDKP